MRFRIISLIFAYFIFAYFPSISKAGNERTYCTSVKPKQYNDVWKRQFESDFKINYDIVDEEFIFYSSEPISIFGFALTIEQKDSLISRINKYKRWNLKASRKKVKLEKQIGIVHAKYTFWRLGDEWSLGPGCDIEVYFLSQTDQIHQMVLVFPKVRSRSNEFDTHKGEPLYFDWKSASELARVLSKPYFDKFIDCLLYTSPSPRD